MRCTIILFSAIILVSMPSINSALATPVTSTEEQGPILLELNAPLLFQPIQDESSDDVSNENASSSNAKEQEQETTSGDNNEANNDKSDSQQSEPSDADTVILPELSDQMKALRGIMRRTIASYAAQPFNTRDNTPANILQVCTAIGCDAQVRRDSSGGQALNAFTCLCWNYPCAGRKIFRLVDGKIVPRVGYGYQEFPAEFLGALALSQVSSDYPLHAGDNECKVRDLVEYEKSTCRSGEDNSFKLIGLIRYLPTDSTWQNDIGEDWSIERLLEEELNRATNTGPAGGTQRLLALAYAVDRRMKRDEPIDGQFKRAQDYLTKIRDHALELQNPDGSWHPSFFTYKGKAGSLVDQLNSTGHMLCWLLWTLPNDQLQDPRIERSVTFLINGLNNSRYRTYVHATSNREIAARLGAVHALSIYNDRLFVPYDEAEKAKQKEAEAKKEQVAAKASKRS